MSGLRPMVRWNHGHGERLKLWEMTPWHLGSELLRLRGDAHHHLLKYLQT